MPTLAAAVVFLALSCVEATCPDEPPSTDYTCDQQKGWGKCDETWMVGHCCSTCFACAEGCGAGPAPGPAPPLPPLSPRAPCDPKATDSARKLLAYLYRISGTHTLTGQVERDHHNDGGTSTGTRYDWDKVAEITGQHPAIYGNQFLWGQPNFTAPLRQAWVDRAIALWQGDEGRGRGITHVNFHLCPPQPRFMDFRCDWADIEGNPPNASLVDAILTDDTDEQRIWFAAMDDMAGYLKQLQENDVPVLWRPFHEMNGGWFWWGASPRMSELWMQMFHRYTQVHDLHNLLWVFGPDGGPGHISDYYPGGDMVDALGLDIYQGQFYQSRYDDVVTLADGRIVALTEVGEAPAADLLRNGQSRYAWFLMWGSFEETHNDPDNLTSLYNSNWFLTQGEVDMEDSLVVV